MKSIPQLTVDRLPPCDSRDATRHSRWAWLFSVAMHVVLTGTLLFMGLQYRGGAGVIENKSGGIVLVDAKSETTEYLSEGDVSDTPSRLTQQPPPLPASENLPPDLPGLNSVDAPVTGVGDEFADAMTGVDALIDGTSSDRPLGGKVTTEVFGVKGTGSAFVYVFDRSASMEDLGGKPLRAAKKQLLESLKSLGDLHQFQIVFYNDETRIFQGEPGQSLLTFATERALRRAEAFVASIRGTGGTDHLGALKQALGFGPDVIFLLTDAEGGFTSQDLRSISNWNRSGAVINAIEFGVGSRTGDSSLRRLAEESRGQYIYKDVRTFRE